MKKYFNFSTKTIVSLVLVFIFNVGTFALLAQSMILNIYEHPESKLNQTELESFQQFATMKGIKCIKLAELTFPSLPESSSGFSVIGLRETPMIFETVDAEVKSENDFFWYAQSQDSIDGSLGTNYMHIEGGKGIKVGEIVVHGTQYLLFQLTSQYHILAETSVLEGTKVNDVDESLIFEDFTCIMTNESCQIDLLVFFLDDIEAPLSIFPTQAAYQAYGQLRSTFIRSRIKHIVNLVGVEEFEDAGWVNEPNASLEKSRVRSVLTSPFSLPAQARDRIKPDLILVLSSGKKYIVPGITGSAATIGASSELDNFVIAGLPYATNASYTAVHEIGHLLHARHENDNSMIPARAHVFTAAGKTFETMMHSVSQTPILQFSNPDVLYYLNPTGTVDRNNACVVQDKGCEIADINSPNECKLTIRASRDCAGNIGISATYVHNITGDICPEGDLIEYEYSLDGLNYTPLGVVPINAPLITTIPITFVGTVYIRATVFVLLAPAGVTITRVPNPCPPPIIPASRSLVESTLYPNPASSYLYFFSDSTEIGQIEIINAQGAVMKSFQYSPSSKQQISLDGLESGVYFLHFFSNTHTDVHVFSKID